MVSECFTCCSIRNMPNQYIEQRKCVLYCRTRCAVVGKMMNSLDKCAELGGVVTDCAQSITGRYV